MEASQAGGVGFQVTRQDSTPTFDPSGTSSVEWTVYFKTRPSGVEASVTVPESDYTPENVGQLILAKAQQIEAIHRLQA